MKAHAKAEFEAGRTIANRYEVRRFIARGGMGAVYEAVDRSTGNEVAVKVLEDQADGAISRRRFFNEAAMCRTLSHQHVVQVHDFGIDEDETCWIAMELLRGVSLHRYLKKHPKLTPEVALACGLQLAAALGAAHAQGFVHRDLKPGNVFVVDELEGTPVLKLLDFGLAKRTDLDIDLTLTGTFMGSPKYVSPEQVKGQELGPRSDVYNVGLILWRMLVGRDLYDHPEASATLVAHVTEPVPSLEDAAPELEPRRELEWLLHTCLAKAPDLRYPDMRNLQSALESVQRRVKGEAAPELDKTLRNTVLPSDPESMWTKRRLMLVGFATVIAVLLLLLGGISLALIAVLAGGA